MPLSRARTSKTQMNPNYEFRLLYVEKTNLSPCRRYRHIFAGTCQNAWMLHKVGALSYSLLFTAEIWPTNSISVPTEALSFYIIELMHYVSTPLALRKLIP